MKEEGCERKTLDFSQERPSSPAAQNMSLDFIRYGNGVTYVFGDFLSTLLLQINTTRVP